MKKTSFRLTICLTITLSTGFAAGCAVSAGKAQYTAHTGHQVGAGPAASSDVAVAFGLDGRPTSGESVAQAPVR